MNTPAACHSLIAFLCFASPQDWTQEVKIIPEDPAPHNEFGTSVSIFGSTALVGAPYADPGGADSGTAYVFTRAGTVWTQQAKLIARDANAGDHFGWSVCLSGDQALIGAPGNDDGGADSGSTYVFVRTEGSWNRQVKLNAGDAAAGDRFGSSVCLHDGRAVIGAPRKGQETGVAYVFAGQGSNWSQEARLSSASSQQGDHFGNSVAIHGDTALVGADLSGGFTNAGSAYVFERSGSSWIEQAELSASDTVANHYFGSSVSLQGDRALVGAHGGLSVGAGGAAYVFLRSGTVWTEEVKLVGDDTATADQFGYSVSLFEDMALIGARQNDMAGVGHHSGAAYVFSHETGRWIEEIQFRASDSGNLDYFGSAVSLYEDRALIGTPGDFEANDSGSAYVFSGAVAGVGYCFGDPDSGTPCPCDNDNDGSIPGSGCDNGIYSSGARLSGQGAASVSEDSLVLVTRHVEPSNWGLYFQAMNAVSPAVAWGDGLRCAGGGEVRLEVCKANGGGLSQTTIPLGAKGGVAPGDTRYYQLWYRTVVFPPCGYGVNNFNTSNGYALTWEP
jgi:hypothetical protein